MTFKQVLNKLNRRDTKFLPQNLTLTKLFLILFFGFTVVFSVKTLLAADTTTSASTSNVGTDSTAVTIVIRNVQEARKEATLEGWNGNLLVSNTVNFMNVVMGNIPIDKNGKIDLSKYQTAGLVGSTTNLVASLFQKPASGIEYLAEVKNNFFGRPTYAADKTGFQSLLPLIPIWKALRNTIYVLCSLIFVGIGIAIMLRIKISPQATITIQTAIPKIITTLILVTFSYAIAGLVIDALNLVLPLVLSLLFSAKGVSPSADLFDSLGSVVGGSGLVLTSWLGNLVQGAYRAVVGYNAYSLDTLKTASFGTIYDLANRAVPAVTGTALGEIAGQIFFGILLGGIGQTFLGGLGRDILGSAGGVVGDVVGGAVGAILIPVVIALLMVFWLIKLYFGLLKCYITLIFKVITGPLEIGLGAIPNSKMGFNSWIIDVLANALVFPVTVLFIVFLNYITDLVSGGGLWIPKQIDLVTLSGTARVVGAGIGLAGLSILAKLPKLVPEEIFKLKQNGFGSAIGEGFAPVTKLGGKAIKSNASAGMDVIDKKFGKESGSKWEQGVAWIGRLAGTRSGDRRRNPPTP